MTAIAVPYLLVCLGVASYAGWVWTRQRRLSRRIRALQAFLEREPPHEEIRSKAA